jgi:NAD(P)-dependent dehydrogenase (short-subunit alcohol dehydrogenase family)
MSLLTWDIIAGANGGIGLETVVSLAQVSSEYHILLCARSHEKGSNALQQIESTHGDSLKSTISVLQLDVTSRESILAAKDEVDKTYGKLDVLINNAGILLIDEMDILDKLRATFETNVFGPWYLTEVFEPLLKKSARPLIINVSSDQGSITRKLQPNNPGAALPGEPYRASKAALNMMSACQRYTYKEWGCRVCAFNPGFCVSNLTGVKGRQVRIERGARPAKDPADAMAKIRLGERDGDFEENGMMHLDGGFLPW